MSFLQKIRHLYQRQVRQILRLKNKRIDVFSPSGPLALEFEKERHQLLVSAVTKGASLAAILVPLFSLLDVFFKSDVLFPFIMIRAGVTLISVGVLLSMKKSLGQKHPYLLGAILAIIVGGSIAVMCHIDQGPVDRYYAGIVLPLLGFGILLPLTLTEGLIVFGSVWLIYFIPNILVVQPHETGIFASNNFFMLSTIVIAIVASQFHLYQRKKQWHTHRRLKKAHKKIQGHARHLEQEVKERTEKLLQSERLAVVGQLAGGIAHDFNNFLTAILGISELLMYTLPETDTSIREDIESISRVGNRAADLVKQLLAFSRKQILQTRTLNLNQVIKDLDKMLSRVLGEHILLETALDPDLGCIQADPVQMEQIILNLCVNARDAMRDGGKLLIETQNCALDNSYCRKKSTQFRPGPFIMLAISDTGTGMSKEIQTKIFEPFFTTKAKGAGTGLGLASVYGVVKQSKGEIYVYSEEGQGTTFKIYLPRLVEEENEIDSLQDRGKSLPRGQETILLVEDEEDVRVLTARMLEKQGYTVMQAPGGPEALSLADSYSESIDLLLTDVVMPVMNGRELAEKLTSLRTGIKVLYISGYTDKMIINQGITESGHEFLQKPYTFENLSYKVRNILHN